MLGEAVGERSGVRDGWRGVAWDCGVAGSSGPGMMISLPLQLPTSLSPNLLWVVMGDDPELLHVAVQEDCSWQVTHDDCPAMDCDVTLRRQSI